MGAARNGIPLHNRAGEIVAHALVSASDFEWLNQWPWCLAVGYATRTIGKRKIYMHRLILGLERGDPRQGEHENRNKLDCRRSNLRIAPRAAADNNQNRDPYANNTSGYRGVSWNKKKRKWQAKAALDHRQHHLGHFDTAEGADAVVKAWRAKHMPFSDDARLVAA